MSRQSPVEARTHWGPRVFLGGGLLVLLVAASVMGHGVQPAASSSPMCYPCATLNIQASVSNANPTVGQQLTFTATVSGGASPYTYSWNFDDGSTPADTSTAYHTYQGAGTYKVYLTVTDQDGNVQQSSPITISVGDVSQQSSGVLGFSSANFGYLVAAIVVAAVVAIALVLLFLSRRRAPPAPVMAGAYVAGGGAAAGFVAAPPPPAVNPTSLEPPASPDEMYSPGLGAQPPSAPSYPNASPPPPPPPPPPAPSASYSEGLPPGYVPPPPPPPPA